MTTSLRFPAGLYGVTPDWSDIVQLESAIRAAARGGLKALQLRHKTASAGLRRELAERCMEVCSELEVLFIVNDDWRLAQAIGAHGVHLGRDDEDPGYVREQMGSEAVIGVSCYGDNARGRLMASQDVNYVAFGAMFSSGTKPQAPPVGVSVLTQARADLPATGIRPAVVAIGGITTENAASVLAAGADSLAVVAGLFQAKDIEQAARNFNDLMITRA